MKLVKAKKLFAGMNGKNPYFAPFFLLALVCIFSLCGFFYILLYNNTQHTHDVYCQERVELIANDFDNQLDVFEDIALQISISDKYNPFFFSRNAYYEVLLLEDFSQYRHYSALTGECFLFYGTDKIFLSSNCTFQLPKYLEHLNQTDYDALYQLLSTPTQEWQMYAAEGEIYLVYPLRGIASLADASPKLCFRLMQNDLYERFAMVLGETKGSLAMFGHDRLLFSMGDYHADDDSFTAASKDGMFHFKYYAQYKLQDNYPFLPIQILLMLVNVLAILFVAKVLAQQTYKPIRRLAQSSRTKYAVPQEQQYENALDELTYLVDKIIQENETMNLQDKQKQKILNRQILRVLLSDNYAFDRLPPLETLKMEMPGPFYFVITLSFQGNVEVSESVLLEFQERFENLTNKERKEYVYGICNYTKKQLILICSICDKDQAGKLVERVQKMLTKNSIDAVVGVGNSYSSLSRVSASWLESTDNIAKKLMDTPQNDEIVVQKPESYEESMLLLCNALTNGKCENALQEFDKMIESHTLEHASVLMQQYLFINFTSQITGLAKEMDIELSDAGISLLISARNMQSFRSAAADLIYEFCEKWEEQRVRRTVDEEYHIYKYVNDHFSDNDISIESVASALDTTTAAVRHAIQNQAGMTYRDYIIYLRIEYAKRLLRTEDISINEVCLKTGYLNVSYFIQLFKKQTGVTPLRFRAGGTEDVDL